jgi:protein-S-isoprenylcysteine O-methyltransferase Ste14
MALILTPVVLLLGHVVVPQQLSLLSARHGWTNGGPGWVNLLGVIPVATGAAFLVWSFRLHFVAVGDSFEMEGTQNYLVLIGPYRFTRNPMYLFGMLIWLGWIIFYGSVAVLAGTVIIWGGVALLVVPWEERNLEVRFGEEYLR